MGRPPDLGGFADLDGTGRAGDYAAYLDGVRSVDAVAEWKRRSFELLEPRPGARLLDVGCGTGEDAVALAALVAPGGRVTGVDLSAQMVREARRRAGAAAGTVEFLAGDVLSLGLPEGAFDGCRCERTLQHVADPAGAVAEMARLVRPGGRVVAAEPDWGTLVVDAGDPAAARVVAGAAGEAIRSGTVGRALRRLMLDAGLARVELLTRTLVVTDLARAEMLFGLSGAAERAVADGRLPAGTASSWRDELERRARDGRFLAAMTAFMARGRRG